MNGSLCEITAQHQSSPSSGSVTDVSSSHFVVSSLVFFQDNEKSQNRSKRYPSPAGFGHLPDARTRNLPQVDVYLRRTARGVWGPYTIPHASYVLPTLLNHRVCDVSTRNGTKQKWKKASQKNHQKMKGTSQHTLAENARKWATLSPHVSKIKRKKVIPSTRGHARVKNVTTTS